MNKSNWIHALAALLIQSPFAVFGMADVGGALAVGILIGIEWMQQVRVNLSEANRPWPTKLSIKDIAYGMAWTNRDRYLDVGLGLIACSIIYGVTK